MMLNDILEFDEVRRPNVIFGLANKYKNDCEIPMVWP